MQTELLPVYTSLWKDEHGNWIELNTYSRKLYWVKWVTHTLITKWLIKLGLQRVTILVSDYSANYYLSLLINRLSD